MLPIEAYALNAYGAVEYEADAQLRPNVRSREVSLSVRQQCRRVGMLAAEGDARLPAEWNYRIVIG